MKAHIIAVSLIVSLCVFSGCSNRNSEEFINLSKELASNTNGKVDVEFYNGPFGPSIKIIYRDVDKEGFFNETTNKETK